MGDSDHAVLATRKEVVGLALPPVLVHLAGEEAAQKQPHVIYSHYLHGGSFTQTHGGVVTLYDYRWKPARGFGSSIGCGSTVFFFVHMDEWKTKRTPIAM